MLNFKITPNQKWIEAYDFLKSMPKRYEWFQFEFGKRATHFFNRILSKEISQIKSAPRSYKKRLVVAEMRESNSKSWFAVVARAEHFKEEKNSDSTVFNIVSRYPDIDGFDPIRDILQVYGPWTANTIPFVPSVRHAVVVAKKVSKEAVFLTKKKNEEVLPEIKRLMSEAGISFDLKDDVYKGLQVVEDLEKIVWDMEFGHGMKRSPHWSKAVRKFKTSLIRYMLNQRDLIASMTNPSFEKYRVKFHLKKKITSKEVRDMEKFKQRLLRST